jgi:hypothetical protein
MTVGQAAHDPETTLVGGQRITGESPADHFDQVVGQIRKIPNGNVLDLSLFSERTSKQVGDVRLPVVPLLDRSHVDSAFVLAHAIVVFTLAGSRNPTNGDHSWLQKEKRTSQDPARFQAGKQIRELTPEKVRTRTRPTAGCFL